MGQKPRRHRAELGTLASAKRLNPPERRAELLESRLLLSAQIAPPDPIIYADSFTGTLAPRPGHTFYVAGFDSHGTKVSQWANASAITPYTTNDLVLNATPSSTNYIASSEGAGGTIGPNLLTNGLTQTQIQAAPGANAAAVGDGGASDPSNSANTISDLAPDQYFFNYNLGSAGGATPNPNGYDLSEIDVITGHQDVRTSIFSVDVLVEPVGSNQFLSLSAGRGFSLLRVPDGAGGTTSFDNGAVQIAIVNSATGQPLAQHIQAVKLSVLDASSFFREFVVTGTPSSPLPAAPSTPTGVAAAFSAGSMTVSWNASSGAQGYIVLRSANIGGPFAAVSSVVNDTSYADISAQPDSTYFYKVTASGNGDSAPSIASPAVTTPSFGATAYIFQSQFWQGTPSLTENFPQINYSGDDHSSQFPLTPGFNAKAFSAFIQGKITTDLGGDYHFLAPTDDDGYLWVNGQLVSQVPGLNVKGRPPATSIPITLAADTAYDFVYLANNRVGQWNVNLQWQPPTPGGTPGPLTLIPASQITPAVDPPPTPSKPSASVASDNTVQLNWSNAGDTSSFAYVVQRAPSDSSGNPNAEFATVGQQFSGPTTAGADGSATWGASTFTDTTALIGATYIYRVGAILLGEQVPAAFSPVTRPVAPGSATLSAALSGQIPASVIAGQKFNLSQALIITNIGNSSINGLLTTKVFLSVVPTVDGNSVELSSTRKTVKFHPHAHLTIKFKVPVIPGSTPAGSYYLVSQINDPNGNTFDAPSTSLLSVVAPQIDLSGSFIKTPVAGRNGKTSLTFSVSNIGNTAAVGPLAFNIDRSGDGLLADAIVVTSSTQKINIKPAKSKKITAVVSLPTGTYFVVIHLDPADAFNDVNPANNAISSATTVTVG